MNMVFQKTRELGEALLASEEYLHMKQVEERAMANVDAAETMGKYLEIKQQLEDMLMSEDPDPEQLRELSQQMDSQQEHLQMIDDIQELTEAREGFSGLIEQVNKVLKFIITGQMDDPEEAAGCASGCEGCAGGCGHNHHLN
ncbi:YlbF family regulator [Eubacteriales bacterium OttesenSCG-928-N13]|nr:YlbF family regulator [Eubacteriales bacterium OttesenSCG-928-N13]